MIQDARVGQGPSIGAIFAWANRRMDAHWPGLFAIAIVVAFVPMLRIVLEQGDPTALHPWAPIGFAVAQELALLLGTAAIVLLAVGPDADGPTPERVIGSTRQALHDAPRLVAVWIAAMLVRWLPAFALARAFPGSGAMTVILSFALIPVGFVCHVAFAGAVIERTGPFNAIVNAFFNASQRGLGLVLGVSLIVGLIDQLPPFAVVWAANVIFPPAAVHTMTPGFPGGMPFPITVAGKFGSGIPWQAHLVMPLLYAPIRAYVAVLYAATALAFANPALIENDAPAGPITTD